MKKGGVMEKHGRFHRRAAGSVAALMATCLAGMACVSAGAEAVEYPAVTPGYRIELPRDEGSHPQFRTEWWYVTGWVEDEAGVSRGFQVTFFRTRPGIHEQNPSRFAPRQILFAHAAISDARHGRLLKAERSAREGFGLAQAAEGSLDVVLGDWFLRRDSAGRLRTRVAAEDFAIELEFAESQPPLLHGVQGFSRKGPQPLSASYYYSLPHLQAAGRLTLQGRSHEVRGVAWMDHEWSSEIMDEEAQGWDWVGLNLDDGAALMAFRMRDAQGDAHWAGGTWRQREKGTVSFSPAQIGWTELRRWRSPRTAVEYPVAWRVRIGERTVVLQPLMDDQEKDARGSTGTLYWEGAVRALDESGRELGRGYLEMTGYGARVRM